MENKYSLIYVTTPTIQEAKKLGKLLLKKRIVACVNLIDGMTAMYWWDDKIQKDQECVLIAKTLKGHVAEVTQDIQNHHSADCPCVIELPIVSGNPQFLLWLENETKTPEHSG